MAQKMRWFDREFDFDLPVWMFPNVLERLRGTPARMEDIVKSLPEEILIARENDSWSIKENAGHLLDRPADLTNRKTHEANHNATPLETILQSFRMHRMEMIERLENMDETAITRTSLHPRLNAPMRLLDMMFFVAEHDDQHLARISELNRILSKRNG